MTGEQLLIKTIKQCNAFEARVIELELIVKQLKDSRVGLVEIALNQGRKSVLEELNNN